MLRRMLIVDAFLSLIVILSGIGGIYYKDIFAITVAVGMFLVFILCLTCAAYILKDFIPEELL